MAGEYSGKVIVVTGAKGNFGQVVARKLAEQGGTLVLLGRKEAALAGTLQLMGLTACAAKAAAKRVLESMASELRGKNITVNGIVPSTIDTPQNREGMPNVDFSKWVQPEEIADAMLYLASEKAHSISGISLDIFGRA